MEIKGLAALLKEGVKLLNLYSESRHREALHIALAMGVNYGIQTYKSANTGGIPLKDKQLVFDLITEYVIKSVPDALTAFNINVATEEGRHRISDMLEARINYAIFEPEGVDEEVGSHGPELVT